jgi:hypothetical protein
VLAVFAGSFLPVTLPVTLSVTFSTGFSEVTFVGLTFDEIFGSAIA